MGTKHVHTDWVANMFWTTGWSAQPLEASVEVWCEASYYSGKGKDGDSSFEQKVLKTESSLVLWIQMCPAGLRWCGVFFYLFMPFSQSELVFQIRWLFPHYMHGPWDPWASDCLHGLSGQVMSATPYPEFLSKSLILLDFHWYN